MIGLGSGNMGSGAGGPGAGHGYPARSRLVPARVARGGTSARVLGYLRPYWHLMAISYGCWLVSIAMDMAIPIQIKWGD